VYLVVAASFVSGSQRNCLLQRAFAQLQACMDKFYTTIAVWASDYMQQTLTLSLACMPNNTCKLIINYKPQRTNICMDRVGDFIPLQDIPCIKPSHQKQQLDQDP
jgi:hypothetical protein